MKARTGIISLIGLVLFLMLDPLTNKPVIDNGLDFPKPDPEKGMSLGYDFKAGDYIYAGDTSFTPPEKPKVKETKKGHYEMTEDDMEDALDYQGH